MPGGRPRKYTDEERKQKIKEKNARYYEANRAKWEGYNHSNTYYIGQIRHMVKHFDLDTQSKVLEAIEHIPATQN